MKRQFAKLMLLIFAPVLMLSFLYLSYKQQREANTNDVIKKRNLPALLE